MKITVRHNTSQDGIEIKFDAKPGTELISKIKGNGFRYSSRQNLWYAKYTDYKWKFAQQLELDANGYQSLPNEPAKPITELSWDEKVAMYRAESFRESTSSVIEYLNRVYYDLKRFWNNQTSLPPTQIILNLSQYDWSVKDSCYLNTPKGRKRPDKHTFAKMLQAVQMMLLKAKQVIKVEEIIQVWRFAGDGYYIDEYGLKELEKKYPHLQYLATDYDEIKAVFDKKLEEERLEQEKIKVVVAKYNQWISDHKLENKLVFFFDKKKNDWAAGKLESWVSEYNGIIYFRITSGSGWIVFSTQHHSEDVFLEPPLDGKTGLKLLDKYPLEANATNDAEKRLKLFKFKMAMAAATS